jgi:hypothetical protein
MDDLISGVRPGSRVARPGDPDKQEPHRPCDGTTLPLLPAPKAALDCDQAVQLRDQLVYMPPTLQHPLPAIWVSLVSDWD